MDWVEWAVGESEGFSAVKFHCWNVFEKDIVLARAARERFPELTFMLDVENNYVRHHGAPAQRSLWADEWLHALLRRCA